MPYSPWVTQRRNLVRNSKPASTTGWSVQTGGGAWTQQAQAVGGPEGITASWYKALCTTANNGSPVGFNAMATGVNGAPVVAGDTVTLSMYVFSTVAASAPRIGGQFYSATGASVGTEIYTTNPPLLANTWTRISATLVVPATAAFLTPRVRVSVAAGTYQPNSYLGAAALLLESGADLLPWFNGDTTNPSTTEQYVWEGVAQNSTSVYQTRVYTPPAPVIPVKNLTTEDVLYNDRVTSYRWEVLEHSNGVDQLIGILDGVSNANLSWTQNVAVKGSGKLEVLDLTEAQAGMLRVADLKLESVRVRPVCSIEGLPENPLGVFLVSAAKEEWENTGRVWSMELLDKCTVPSQDVFDQSYAVAAGTLILQEVRLILASCNEYIAVNSSSTLTTSSGMVWEAGTSKLKIINDLLDVAGYNALWMDGYGNFQVTPRVLPADRSIMYEVLGIPRELVDGDQAIYSPSWQRDRDSFEVPNKVIAVQAAGGDDVAALIGTWTNEDPNSPYSYQSRGRWIPHVLDSVECPDGTNAEIVAFLQKRAQTTLVQMSAVQAQVSIEHLPIPARVSDVVRFAHTQAGVDSRHVITKMQLDANPLGTMKTTLQEVISL